MGAVLLMQPFRSPYQVNGGFFQRKTQKFFRSCFIQQYLTWFCCFLSCWQQQKKQQNQVRYCCIKQLRKNFCVLRWKKPPFTWYGERNGCMRRTAPITFAPA